MEGTKAHPTSKAGANSGSKESGWVYWSQVHKLAFERLRFAVTSRAPLTIFIGRTGTGRSRLIVELIAVDTPGFEIAAFQNPHSLPGEVYSDVLSTFEPDRVHPDAESNRLELIKLLKSFHASRRFPVLIVDDAQQLSDTYLKVLCSLCEENIASRPMLKLVVVGSVGLTDILLDIRPDLTGPAFVLDTMSEEDVAGYIRARLSRLGVSEVNVTDDALKEMFLQTGGIPAKANIICNGIQKRAAEQTLIEIDRGYVRMVASELRSYRTDKTSGENRRETSASVLDQPIPRRLADDMQNRSAAVFSQPNNTCKTWRLPGRKTAIAVAFLILAGASIASFLALSDKSIEEQFSLLKSEDAENPKSVINSSSRVARGENGDEIKKANAAQSRVSKMSDALADTEPTANGLYQAALKLSGTAADAAVVSYARAALAGHERSAYYLGQIYETGEGVPVDHALAVAWYKLAAPKIRGAADRLSEIHPKTQTGVLAEPVQLYSNLSTDGFAEIVWTSSEGLDPSRYRVEFSAADGSAILDIPDIEVSAVRMMVPSDVRQWRVVAIDDHGGQEVASPWIEISLR